MRIVDTLIGTGRHAVAWKLHCAPEVQTILCTSGVEIVAGGVRVRLSVPSGLSIALEDGLYSPSYGVTVPIRTIAVRAEVELSGPMALSFDLVPA